MDTHQNLNLETTHNHHHHLTSSQDFKRTHKEFFIKNLKQTSDDDDVLIESCDHKAESGGIPSSQYKEAEASVKMVESGRERLKRHRVEMSGRVWIPDIWGQEDMLKNWIDCTVFDSCLEKNSIMSARKALMQEGRTSNLMSARKALMQEGRTSNLMSARRVA